MAPHPAWSPFLVSQTVVASHNSDQLAVESVRNFHMLSAGQRPDVQHSAETSFATHEGGHHKNQLRHLNQIKRSFGCNRTEYGGKMNNEPSWKRPEREFSNVAFVATISALAPAAAVAAISPHHCTTALGFGFWRR